MGQRILDSVQIANPCPADWESMRGDERMRFCELCSLNVYNLSGLTKGEAEALLTAGEGGRVCLRIYRRADGTVITADCPVGLAALRRRLAAVTAVAGACVALFLSWIGFTAWQTYQGRSARVLPLAQPTVEMGDWCPPPAARAPAPPPAAAPASASQVR